MYLTGKNNNRIHGVPLSSNKENTDDIVIKLFSEKLHLAVSLDSIDRSHRLGNTNSSRPPAIIVKFSTYRVRASVWNIKKQLKGTGIHITEDLTTTRATLYKKCCDKWDKRNTWTRDGAIMVKVSDRIHKVENESQLLQITQ